MNEIRKLKVPKATPLLPLSLLRGYKNRMAVEIIHDEQWETLARNMLRAELMRRGLSYAKLRDALAEIGVDDTEGAIKSKLSRGRFTAVFFLQCMTAIGVDWLRIPGVLNGDISAVGQFGAQHLARGSGTPVVD